LRVTEKASKKYDELQQFETEGCSSDTLHTALLIGLNLYENRLDFYITKCVLKNNRGKQNSFGNIDRRADLEKRPVARRLLGCNLELPWGVYAFVMTIQNLRFS